MGVADAVHQVDHARGAEQRIAPARHRRGTAWDSCPVSTTSYQRWPRRVHHADGLALGLEDRSLLDVQPRRRRGWVAHGQLAGVADAPALAQGLAVHVPARQAVVEREHAGKDARDTMAGAKREPSSLVQITTSIGRSVSMRWSLSVRITSSPPSTP